MRVTVCALLSALLAANVAEGAEGRDSWRCAVMGQRQNALYLVDDGAKSYVKFFGQRIACRHSLDGTTHRWVWGSNSVALSEDLVARYYEGGNTDPKGQFRCKPATR